MTDTYVSTLDNVRSNKINLNMKQLQNTSYKGLTLPQLTKELKKTWNDFYA